MRYPSILLFFIIVLSSSFVFGADIGPERLIYEYVPGSNYTAKLFITVDKIPAKVHLSASGSLAPMINFDETDIILDKYESVIYYSVIVPETIAPGIYDGKVNADFDISQTGDIGLALRASQKVVLNATNFGLVPDIEIDQGKDQTELLLSVANSLNQDVNGVNMHIRIFNGTDIAFEEDKYIDLLKPFTRKTIRVNFKAAPGKYHLRLDVEYLELSYRLDRDFEIGNRKLVLERMEMGSFEPEGTSMIDLEFFNNWNQETEVSGIFNIVQDKSEIDAEIPKTRIHAYSTDIISVYSANLSAGQYPVEIIVSHEGGVQRFSKNIVIGVEPDEQMLQVQTGLLVILALIVMMLFVYLRNRSKLDGNKKEKVSSDDSGA